MNFDECIRKILIKRCSRNAASICHYLSYKRNPNIKDENGMTLLHMVAADSLDSLSIVQYLYELGSHINIQDNNQLTPLHLAVTRSNYKIAEFLIDHGAAVNIQEKYGKTALYLLIDDIKLHPLFTQRQEPKRKLLLTKLLQNGADPNLPDVNGETPLMRAITWTDLDIVKELLVFGGNVNLCNIDSDTCLHQLLWSFKPNKAILVELVKHGACVNCIGSVGINALDFMLKHYPAKTGLENAKLLIKTATLVNWKSKINFELEMDREFNFLREYIDSCYTEVCRMKSCSYSDKSNLCHFVLNGGNASQKGKSSEKSIFDEVIVTLGKYNFPIYNDLVRAHFDRIFLLEKLLKINIYTKNKNKNKDDDDDDEIAIHLNSDIILEIAANLSDSDLFNLVRAYSNPL